MRQVEMIPATTAGSGFDANPDYLVGRDPDGHWLAVETHGLGGGVFTTRQAALSYARFETGRRAGAIAMATAPIRLV